MGKYVFKDIEIISKIFTDEDLARQAKSLPSQKMMVYYGIAKQNKVLKKRSISIIYENCYIHEDKSLKSISRWMHIVYSRVQKEDEKIDSIGSTRSYTKYDLFLDEKPFNGDWEAILHQNFIVEKNHVPKKERLLIKDKLQEGLFKHYQINKPYLGTLEF